ncbi:CAP domain-containing protein [Bacillus badius]|uniref:CAP domain-containing protein n=1 Tax=Bacillus badius TaxID=1455 RepID=UPI000596D826|nr:CAP domain-containing protein [Bacillus badius]KIL76298.1 hypothetical protein SD78_0400 [Bacillus badius]
MLRSFLYTVIVITVAFLSWPAIEKQLDESKAAEKAKAGFLDFTEQLGLGEFVADFSGTDGAKSPPVKKPALSKPAEQAFSIHNIELADSKEQAEQVLGSPKRSSANEYGVEWHTYHTNYQNFVMAAYDENGQVAGLYTNQDLIASKSGIKLGSAKEAVRKTFGQPLAEMRKGLVYMRFDEKEDYDTFDLDNSFVTVFYDKHENNTVTAIQLIRKDVEQKKSSFYVKGHEPLKEGFEYQLFDLTNAARAKRGLAVLKWDDQVKGTARKHSSDMAKQNYFSHTNKRGQSPFDRMEADGVSFTTAGENLAYGQFSSIFAHEGLMNSLGHRENILRPEYRFLGVGAAFNEENQPYYTENFLTK